jgi:DNA adenine methylase
MQNMPNNLFGDELATGITAACPCMLFRYPGGKGKMVAEFIDRIKPTSLYYEPFVGGGSVALAVAAKFSGHLFLNDLDFWIAEFWRVVSAADACEFDDLYARVAVRPTIERFRELRKKIAPDDFSKRHDTQGADAAFAALFFNRTTFSGILSSGPIGGEFQTNKKYDVAVRWNTIGLQRDLITARKLLVGRTTVTALDWRQFLRGCPSDGFIYLDPPYYKAGNALYGPTWRLYDHVALRDFLCKREDWFLSYDNHATIRCLYSDCTIESRAHYRSMSSQSERPSDESELFISPKEQ